MLESIIYVSRAKEHLNTDDLLDIVQVAQKNNATNSVTGALAYIEGWFIQYLEGKATNVNALYRKINQDTRHSLLMIRHYSFTKERLFTGWNMQNVSEELYIWLDHVRDTTGDLDLARLTPHEALVFFRALAVDAN